VSYSEVKIKTAGKFLKIDAGAPQDIRLFDSSPVEVMKHAGPTGSPLCEGQGCGWCAEGDAPKQKFVTNVYSHTLKRVMIYEYGTSVAKQLQSIAKTLEEESRDIMDTDLKIEATGSGMQKRYTVTPRMTSKPLPEGLVRHKINGEIPF
jgi:hypothetical protein